MKKIKSIEHAQEVLGTAVNFDLLRDGLIAGGMELCEVQPQIDDIKIKMIVKANNKLNGNWKRVYGFNRGYCVWKEFSRDDSKPSGFGSSLTDSDYWLAYTFVGARLEVGTNEEALYIGKDFNDLFESAWLIIPIPETDAPATN